MRKFTRLSLCRCLVLISGLFTVHFANAQEQIMVKGTVYDVSQKIPLSSVTVLSKSGTQTLTDTLGEYKIIVYDTDSIYFSYLGKRSPWFSVKQINAPWSFDIALHVYAPDLPPIYITKSSYREDSLRNRKEYERIFDFHNPRLGTTANGPESGSAGVGFDLDAIVDMFHFAYNKRQRGYQRFFEWEEQEKYIDHRFNKNLIKKLTDLPDDKMQAYIKQYRPTYEFVDGVTDFDLGLYIQKCKADFDTGHPSTANTMMATFRSK